MPTRVLLHAAPVRELRLCGSPFNVVLRTGGLIAPPRLVITPPIYYLPVIVLLCHCILYSIHTARQSPAPPLSARVGGAYATTGTSLPYDSHWNDSLTDAGCASRLYIHRAIDVSSDTTHLHVSVSIGHLWPSSRLGIRPGVYSPMHI